MHLKDSSAFFIFTAWWSGTESNCRHRDFQSLALPTELPDRSIFCVEGAYYTQLYLFVNDFFYFF